MSQSNRDWDDYWRVARTQHDEVDPTGTDATAPFFLAEAPAPNEATTVLDLGSGAGVLSSKLINSGYSHAQFLGVDLSYDAAQMTMNNTKGAAIQSDLAKLPVATNTIDWVVSQFAIEYAPPSAWEEAARVIKPGGRLTVVAHACGSIIYEEHKQALTAFGVIDRVVRAALTTDQNGDPMVVSNQSTLMQAIEQLQSIMTDDLGALAMPMTRALLDCLLPLSSGKGSVSNTLRASLGRWLLDYRAYKGRIESMLQAALAPANFMLCQQALVGVGFSIQTAGFLTVAKGGKLGFKLSALKTLGS